MAKKNAFYAQSGGVTSVINATACGLIETARRYPDLINNVYAGHNGIIGALTEDLIDTSAEDSATIAALKHTPGGAFGSCRYKLKDLESNRAEYERLIEVFQAHDIGYFFYNGGGDSQDTAYKVSQISEKMGYPITCIGIPKTIDNDLPFTDTCPGFGSVAKYVAISTKEAALDIQSMCKSSTKVFILEVMGRHAGWIAAAGGLAAEKAGDPPHLILFPETAFDETKFLAKVDEAVKEHGYCVIVASEGTSHADGSLISASTTVVDAFGHQQLGGIAPVLTKLIKDNLGYKYHYAVSDYLQRAARHISSKVDVEQAYAVGKAAVEFAVNGKNAVMPVIQRDNQAPYQWSIGEACLSQVANQEKMMPADFITEDGFGITQAARDYLEPLIQGEDYPPYKDGMPVYARLKMVPVVKKLNTDFKV